MGTLLRRCVKVRIAIELSFGVVSGVGPGIHVLVRWNWKSMCLKAQGEVAVSGMVLIVGFFENSAPLI